MSDESVIWEVKDLGHVRFTKMGNMVAIEMDGDSISGGGYLIDRREAVELADALRTWSQQPDVPGTI